MSRRRSLVRALALLLVGALLAAGCGLAAQDEPHVIAAGELPAELLDPTPATTTTTVQGDTAGVTVYLIRRQDNTTRLAPVTREVTDPTSAGDRINVLLGQTTEREQAEGLTSSIPTDTVLLDWELDRSVQELVVDLSGAIFDVESAELAQAFAQIVWTVTEMEGVRRVRFLVDGQAYRAPNAEGIEQDGAVRTSDYASLAPL